MSPLPATPEMETIARRVVWFEPPAQSLTDVAQFLAYAMTYGDDADLREVREYLTDDD